MIYGAKVQIEAVHSTTGTVFCICSYLSRRCGAVREHGETLGPVSSSDRTLMVLADSQTLSEVLQLAAGDRH